MNSYATSAHARRPFIRYYFFSSVRSCEHMIKGKEVENMQNANWSSRICRQLFIAEHLLRDEIDVF